MSVRRLAEEQPASFDFTPENADWCAKEITKYPDGRQASAIIPLMWRAQKQHDYWLPKPAIEKIAGMLGMPYIRALEVATFYTMFNLAPVGRYFIQFCGTTPCVLQGADAIKQVLEQRIGPQRHVTADGLFSWLEVECLGACCNAPMVQINDDYFEDLTAENFAKLLDDLAAGKPVHVGSQVGRMTSEPVGGLTSLTSFYGDDGRSGSQTRGRERPSAGDLAAANGEHARHDQPPGEPASERLKQVKDGSTAVPPSSIVDTGTTRTDVRVSTPDREKGGSKLSEAHGGEPSQPAGHEPAGKKS